MAKRTLTKSYFSFDSYYIPIIHHKEFRTSIRFSITKKGLVIRSPIHTNSNSIKSKAETWVKNLAKERPAALGKFIIQNYQTGDVLTLMEKPYYLCINYHPHISNIVRWQDNNVYLSVNDNLTKHERSTVVSKLLAKYANKNFLVPIIERVTFLNFKYFKTTINKISLKHNHSNWGSCSAKGNINLSSRLLFAPLEVIDYVIVHELAHTIEMNHSKRFWSIVAKACPKYKKHEKWLKENSHLCNF